MESLFNINGGFVQADWVQQGSNHRRPGQIFSKFFRLVDGDDGWDY